MNSLLSITVDNAENSQHAFDALRAHFFHIQGRILSLKTATRHVAVGHLTSQIIHEHLLLLHLVFTNAINALDRTSVDILTEAHGLLLEIVQANEIGGPLRVIKALEDSRDRFSVSLLSYTFICLLIPCSLLQTMFHNVMPERIGGAVGRTQMKMTCHLLKLSTSYNVGSSNIRTSIHVIVQDLPMSSSSVKTVPPVRMARSLRIDLRLSPNPGALTATTWS
jgi:hypothetical protein